MCVCVFVCLCVRVCVCACCACFCLSISSTLGTGWRVSPVAVATTLPVTASVLRHRSALCQSVFRGLLRIFFFQIGVGLSQKCVFGLRLFFQLLFGFIFPQSKCVLCRWSSSPNRVPFGRHTLSKSVSCPVGFSHFVKMCFFPGSSSFFLLNRVSFFYH
jgi:hypothetical protein